ncbi:DUF3849 domain-containing protein [Faecalicatena contorta]|uniref:DUF3849 domain-containing protein n=1 Tax=Faecalicatena contorta TaxID=39482 RepID=UPI001F410F3D|nr:DUF3849 domain-containing protein [Faecalicatena contorta]MCF2681988.1 DUF3849 domain-containing protein [Faecalicatena contorta]
MGKYRELLEKIEENQREHERLEREIREIENEPIRDSDVIVLFSGSIDDYYISYRITNMDGEQVEKLLHEAAEFADVKWDGTVPDYLAGQGADMIPVLDSINRWNGYSAFYDFEYDYNENEIHRSDELTSVQQAYNIMNRMDFWEPVFNDEERNLIVKYARQFDNSKDTYLLAQELRDSLEKTDVRIRYEIMENARAELEGVPDQNTSFTERNEYGYRNDGVYPLSKGRALELYQEEYPVLLLYPDNTEVYAANSEEIVAYEGMFGIEKAVWDELSKEEVPSIPEVENELERELLYGETDRFGIYQLKDGDDLHYHRFERLDNLQKFGLKVEKDNYELVYTAPLQEGQTLDDIFEEFNLFRPEDFKGHSLSVSDIVLLHKNGENQAQYVDSFGFREVPQFLQMFRNKEKEKEADLPYIAHYYVIDDLEKEGALDIREYGDMDEALTAYFSLPNDKRKAFGIQNSQPVPESQDFIQCIGGMECIILDYQSKEGWNNPEITAAIERIDIAIDLHDTEIAYQIGERYFTIQNTEGGFDYTFYDAEYRELDGGMYDNLDLTITEAINEILEDEHLKFEDCRVINYEDFMERVEAANRIEEKQKIPEYLPVYRFPFSYAVENGEIESYRASKKENIACKNAIEKAIRENFDGMHLQHDVAKPVLVEYGSERVCYVLASTLRELEYDGRFSRDNKAWAHTIPVYEDKDSWGNGNTDFIVTSHPAVLDGFISLARAEILERENNRKLPPVSNMTQPETSLNNMSRADIEETVLDYAQSMADEAGYDVQVMAARVYGSRIAGIENENSDVDVVIEFQGDIREDDFFNMLHEDGLSIGGMTVDINPITAEKSGTIEEYLVRANEYLEEKVKSFREAASDQQKVEVTAEKPIQTLTFYVAECMEFPTLGEYHDNLTFAEAVSKYESIPPERMNGIRGIGFVLHTEGNEDYMDTTMELLNGITIDVDGINEVPELRGNPLVQQAIRDVIAQFPDKEVWDVETRARENRERAEDFDKDCNQLAVDIDRFSREYDPYGYRDAVKNREENISSIYRDLQKGENEHIREWMQSVIDEEEPAEDVKKAKDLLRRMDDLVERRERNPLTKVEELEEANYNQIDGILNNTRQKEPARQEKKDLSIMERLERSKERIAQDGQKNKTSKDAAKKPEWGMD